MVLTAEVEQESDGTVLALAAIVAGGLRLVGVRTGVGIIAGAIEEHCERVVDRRTLRSRVARVFVVAGAVDEHAYGIVVRGSLADVAGRIGVVAAPVNERTTT